MQLSSRSCELQLNQNIQKIKLLLLDVDGVLTEGSIILTGSKDETIIFNIHDGLAVKLAQTGGIKIGIITGRTSDAVKRRADELNIDILYQGQQDKIKAYEQIKEQLALADEEIAYIGDDLPDLKILKKVGLSFTVSDACNEVKKAAAYVTRRRGGKGAVREVIELILKKQGKWDSVIGKYIDRE